MTIIKIILFLVSAFVLYNQYKALFQLTTERPEDFNPTKRYWWLYIIPFYAVYLVMAGEINEYKTRKQNG